MWNVFDTSFVVIIILYLGLRIKGLARNDSKLLRSRFPAKPVILSTASLLYQLWRRSGDLIYCLVGRVYSFHGRRIYCVPLPKLITRTKFGFLCCF